MSFVTLNDISSVVASAIIFPFCALASQAHSSIVDIFIDHRQLPNRASTIKDADTANRILRDQTIVPAEVVRSKGGHLEINKDRSPRVVRDWPLSMEHASFCRVFRVQPFTVNTRVLAPKRDRTFRLRLSTIFPRGAIPIANNWQLAAVARANFSLSRDTADSILQFLSPLPSSLSSLSISHQFSSVRFVAFERSVSFKIRNSLQEDCIFRSNDKVKTRDRKSMCE